MGLLSIVFAFSFIALFLVNITWLGLNLYSWVVHGLQFLLQGMNFTESVYASAYLKWILLADVLWLVIILIFLLKRKNYKTDANLHYLKYNQIKKPKICVSMHAYNEELGIEQSVKDFINQKNVFQLNVIDNHSTDNTIEIAKRFGANVITKNKNKGYAHSWVLGLKEALKTDANIIVLTDADGTFNGYDIDKMIPYLENCDMVIGSRLTQVLSEKGNQNSMFYVWGNKFIASLLQIKYFSLSHMGVLQLTDAGCSYRCIRRESLEKIIDKFSISGTDEVIPIANGSRIALFTTSMAIENNLKIVEIPITFKKRIGNSKFTNNKWKGFMFGLEFIWFILRS
jgi:glycosyltransferase involved in cell wall biosynthesis